MRILGFLFLQIGAILGASAPTDSVSVATARLQFSVADPVGQGSLNQQLKSELAQIRKQAGRARLVKVRAFVPEAGDAGLVQKWLVKELPSRTTTVSVIRVGALLTPNAKVVLESVAEAPTVQNPNGLVFVSGQLTTAPKGPNPAAAPLAEKSLANLKTAFAGFQVEPGQVLRITCFASTLVDQAQVRAMIKVQFPNAAANLVQIQKEPENQEVECEAVGRLSKAPAEPVQLVNPTNAAFAQAMLLNAPRVILTTTFTGAATDDGMRSAFRALGSALQQAGSSFESVYYVYGYPTSAAMLQKYRDIRWEFLKRDRAPASTNLAFEGVMDPAHGFGLDVIALPAK